MRTSWLHLAAGAGVAVLAVASVVRPAVDHPGTIRPGTAQGAGQGADAPVGDAPGGAAMVQTESPPESSPATVPPATVAVTPTVTRAASAAAPAPAMTTPAAAAPAPVGRVIMTSPIGAKALRLIRYPWTKLGYQLSFHGPMAGFYGLTDCRNHHIDIYVVPGQSVDQVAFVTAFEIGHAIDCNNTAPGHQARWPALRGFHVNGAWFPSCSCSEDNFASGDYAEVFARWQVGAAYPWRSTLAPPPRAAQLTALITLFG